MDCTYKTNRFGMPLLNIVGIMATYRGFNTGFTFIFAAASQVTIGADRSSRTPW